MTSVLDKPTVDTTTLNETWLDDELVCHHSDNGAEWLWVMKCCGKETFLCTHHDTNVRERMAKLLDSPRRCVCGECGHDFGFHPPFHTVYQRNPV